MHPAINRRNFLKQAGMTGTALVIGYTFVGCARKGQKEPEGVIALFKANWDDVPNGLGLNPFVLIEPSGAITLMAHRPDMGQGTYQSMPLLIAEELDVRLDQVTIKHATGDSKYGDQGVGGSASVRTMWEPMRKVGAAARTMLIAAAAEQWGIPVSGCATENGEVINLQTKARLAYGALVERAAKQEVPQNPELKNPAAFKQIGKSVPRPDIVLKANGTASFGLDMRKEGMVFAVIERAPSFSAVVKSLDDTAARAVPGVLQVIRTHRPLLKHRFEGVAVIAENFWAAQKGRLALNIQWEEPDNRASTASIFSMMKEKAVQSEGKLVHKAGNFSAAFQKAAKRLDVTYETPFVAHAAMEPQNVLVDVRADVCEIWAPTQFPQWCKQEAAQLLGIPEEKVTVHVPFLGGGFGRRAMSDFVLEGVLLSKEIGKPVKVVWSREDDLTQSPFRPGSVNRLQGALDAFGTLTAFRHKVVAPSISYSLFPGHEGASAGGGEMDAVERSFYDCPNFESRYVFVDVDPIPLAWWRSVYASTNVFGQECFMDELAELADMDPVAFRRAQLHGAQEYLAVLNFLAEKAEWSKPLPKGWARGIAMTSCFETTTGQVVEVSRSADGAIKVERVVTAIDCGIAVNPDNVRAQCEGCVVMGLGAALKPGIVFEQGRPVQRNFDTYQLPRQSDTPRIEVHILPSAANPTGSGEPALPPVAPALANALYALTGKRIRTLPIDLEQYS